MLHARQKKSNVRKNAIIAAAVLFVLVMIFVPRWRHATACTLTGGRWTSKDMVSYLVKGCRVKSRTAEKPCTGQLRDECDHSQCDLARRGGTAGGMCPKFWIKNGYDKQGTFRSF